MSGIKSETIEWWKTCRDCGCRFKDSMTSFGRLFPIPVRQFKVKTGQCPECRKKQNALYDKLFFARDLHWTFENVKEYFIENPPYKGQELIVLDTSYNMNTYFLVTVENPEHTRQKRIVIKEHVDTFGGRSFYRSGQNCFSPKGQSRLLPYHPVIGNLIKKKGVHNKIDLELKPTLSR